MVIPLFGARTLPRQYAASAVLCGAASAHPFHRSLAGVAIGRGDTIHLLGDDEVRVFGQGGEFVRAWPAPSGAACLATGADGRVFVGSIGRIDIFDAGGRPAGGFDAINNGQPAAITSIKVFRQEIFAGDAVARCIHRYDSAGRRLGEIGNRDKTRGFMLPNKWLDFAVDTAGVIHATDTGRHRVSRWAIDGSPLGAFGAFGQIHPSDFVGCCNPVNLALTPDGKVVTGEKMIARVKVYEPDGTLLALIDASHFDPANVHLPIAIDSTGRILVADPVRRVVKIFSLTGRTNAQGADRGDGGAA